MQMIKNSARILVFLVLLAFLLSGATRLLEQKDSAIGLKPFLDHAEEYDVLFLGDSQVRYGVFPLELYHKYGIAAYNLGSSNCSVPLSYWRLMNALEYAQPKLVMLSVTDAEVPELTPRKGEWLHVALGAFPMSLSKARAILDLTNQDGEDSSGVAYSDIRRELFFPLYKYHSRWSSLTQEDFSPSHNAHKGAVARVHVTDPQAESQMVGPDECLPEEGYGFVYLRKIIEECQKRNIPIVLYQPPYPILPQAHMGTHTSAKIAEEYGVPMLNFVDMDRVVDYYTDCGDPGSHLNVSGVRKLTDFLGRYITDHYDLPDRREDAAYAHWNDEWNAYVDEKIRMIAEDADSLRSRLMLLHDDSFSLVLTVRPGFDYDHRSTKKALQNIARAHVYEDDDEASEKLNPLMGLDDAADFNKGYMFIVDRDAGETYEYVQEFYGIGEQEYETSFGYVFCRMDGEWIDLSITQDDEETYYFDDWDDQDQDVRFVLIDRRTGKPALTMAFSRHDEEQP
ncbi:MAG: hypothetical protein IJO02_11240 [Clostridia bacterium]|nr:hypothetical protein [Clostridia bacterium]